MIRIFRILSYSTEPKNKHLIISKQQLRVRHARQKRELRSSYFLVRGSYQRISFSSNYQSILPKNAQETTTTKKAFWRCWWFWDGWRPWTRVWKICSKKAATSANLVLFILLTSSLSIMSREATRTNRDPEKHFVTFDSQLGKSRIVNELRPAVWM